MMKKMFGGALCIIRRTEETTVKVFFYVNELFTRLKTKQKTVYMYNVHDNNMHAYLINNITISLKKVTVFVQLLIALMVCRSGVFVSLPNNNNINVMPAYYRYV